MVDPSPRQNRACRGPNGVAAEISKRLSNFDKSYQTSFSSIVDEMFLQAYRPVEI